MKQDVAPPPCRASGLGAPSARPASDLPLAGLAGSDLSRRFRHWRGASGRRYLFSVFPLHRPGSVEEAPRFDAAVILAVSRDAAGDRRIIAADETGTLPDLFYASAEFRNAVQAGANEVHLHLLTEGAAERSALLRDLVPVHGA